MFSFSIPDGPQAQSDWGQVKPKWDTKSRGTQNAGTTTTPTTPTSTGNGNRSGSSSSQGPPFLPPQLLKSLLNKEVDENHDPNLLPGSKPYLT